MTIPYFKITRVFDISQTEGKELPTIGVNELLKDVDGAKDFIVKPFQAERVVEALTKVGNM